MGDVPDEPMPSLAWFKKVREAIRKKDPALVREFAALANRPDSGNTMLDFLDDHFPRGEGSWRDVSPGDVPGSLEAWR